MNKIKIPLEPPWKLSLPSVMTSVESLVSKQDPSDVIRYEFLKFYDSIYSENLVCAYTDGSKGVGGTGAAFFIPKFNVKRKFVLPKESSVFCTELVAIFQCLSFLDSINPLELSDIVIFSDSQSALVSIQRLENGVKHSIIYDIINMYNSLCSKKISVKFCWIPSHCGIKGNETVDKLAKEAACGVGTSLSIAFDFCELYKFVDKFIMNIWQSYWEDDPNGRSYFTFHPEVSKGINTISNCRKNEIILFRLKSGHCLLNYPLFRKNQHPDGLCDFCKVPQSIKHFLFECVDFLDFRIPFYTKFHDFGVSFTLKSICENPDMVDELVSFIHNIGRSHSI